MNCRVCGSALREDLQSCMACGTTVSVYSAPEGFFPVKGEAFYYRLKPATDQDGYAIVHITAFDPMSGVYHTIYPASESGEGAPPGYQYDGQSGLYYYTLFTEDVGQGPGDLLCQYNPGTGAAAQYFFPQDMELPQFDVSEPVQNAPTPPPLLSPPPPPPPPMSETRQSAETSNAEPTGRTGVRKISNVGIIVLGVVILLLGGAVGGHYLGLYSIPFLPDWSNSSVESQQASPASQSTPDISNSDTEAVGGTQSSLSPSPETPDQTASEPKSNNMTKPNGDGCTPYNLQWTDGSKGLISFNVQFADMGSPDITYDFTLYHDGTDIFNSGFSSQQGIIQIEENIAEFMQYPGEYVFSITTWDNRTDTPLSEEIISPPYVLNSEGIQATPGGLSSKQADMGEEQELSDSFSGTLSETSNFHEYILTLDKASDVGFYITCSSSDGSASIEWNVAVTGPGGEGFSVWNSDVPETDAHYNQVTWEKPSVRLPAGTYTVTVNTAEYMFYGEDLDEFVPNGLTIDYFLQFLIS